MHNMAGPTKRPKKPADRKRMKMENMTGSIKRPKKSAGVVYYTQHTNDPLEMLALETND